jgi:hypothetical protein
MASPLAATRKALLLQLLQLTKVFEAIFGRLAGPFGLGEQARVVKALQTVS